MRSATAALPLAESQREVLKKLARSQTAEHRDVQRARALLLAAEGVANTRIGADLGVSPTTVSNWRERFQSDGLKGIGVVRAGRGRKPSISPQKVAEIVHVMLHEKPLGRHIGVAGRWLRRWGVAGDGERTGRRAASSRTGSRRSSSASRSALRRSSWMSGLYRTRRRTRLLPLDEKCQIQALTRTQPSPPIKPGGRGR